MLIANRVLKLRRPTGHIDISIRIFAPQRRGDSWMCHFEIDWPEKWWLWMPAALTLCRPSNSR